MKVLVVDDSNTMRRIIKNVVTRLGYKDIYEGADGIEGLEQLNKHPDIGIILTDWNMPTMNGLQFIKKVRADERFKEVPIIMITTEGGKREVITALKAGVNNYIVKPFTPQVLKDKLTPIFGEQDTTEEVIIL